MQTVAIKTIKKLRGTRDKYDLTVAKHHNFFANGVLVHNCRCLARREKDTVTLWSRQGKQITTMSHIVEELVQLMQPGDILDGELYSRKISFQQIASYIRAEKNPKPAATQMEYHVYDLMGSSPFGHRYGRLVQILNRRVKTGRAAKVKLVITTVVTNSQELDGFHNECLKAGYEGAMIRHGDAHYEAGKRSKSLLKVKKMVDEDFEIVKVRPGRGTHADMAIMTCVTAEGAEFDITAPGTHDEKREFLANGQKLIGKNMTVKFFEWTTSEESVPRFPIAVRLVELL